MREDSCAEQGLMLCRSGSLKGVTRCAEPPLSVPSGLNRQHHQPGSPVRPLPPFAGCLQPAPAASQKLLGSPLPQPPPELARGLQQSSAAMHVHTIASTSQVCDWKDEQLISPLCRWVTLTKSSVLNGLALDVSWSRSLLLPWFLSACPENIIVDMHRGSLCGRAVSAATGN